MESLVFTAGVAPYALMRRAGEAAARFIALHASGASRIVVLTGSGNNAGDALVAAAELSRRFPVAIRAVKPLRELSGAAAEALRELPGGIPVEVCQTLAADDLRQGDFIVDGLLGTGFRGTLRPQYAQFIRSVNASGLPVAALDLPSGLDADTGHAAGEVIRATLTITFGFPKVGLFLAEGPRCRGMLRVVPLGLPLPCETASPLLVYTADDAARDLPMPEYDTHKFRRGALLIAAGSRRYPGAAALAALAALRAEAGIVKVLIPEGTRLPGVPAALITEEVPATAEGTFSGEAAAVLNAASGAYRAIAAGPGWSEADPGMLRAVLDFPAPLVLDADALNLAARHPELWKKRRAVPAVITPHPGEALRLADAFGVEAETDRMKFASALARKLGAVTVLKGAQSVVASPDGAVCLNTSGSPDLATAGSGDVLTGLIGSLLAAGCEAERAARLGVWIHGAAGEISGTGTVADDLPSAVRRISGLLRRRGELY